MIFLAAVGFALAQSLPQRVETTVLIDVADLVHGVQRRLATPTDPTSTLEQREQRVTQVLAELIQTWMRPAFDPARGRVEAVGPTLLAIVGDEARLVWVNRFLDLQQKSTGAFDVQIRILEAPRGAFARLGISESSTTFGTDAELEALLARAKDTERVNLLYAPAVRTLPLGEASVMVGERVSYVKDWRMETVEPGPQEIAVPIIDSVFNGMEARSRVVPVEPDRFGLELSFTSSRLERPITTATASAGGDRALQVALPKVDKITLDTKIVMADGASVLLVAPSNEPAREVAVAVTLRRAD